MKIGILEPEFFSKDAITLLNNIGRIDFLKAKKNLKTFVSDKNVLFIRLKYYINKELLENADELKYLCSPTTGLNHIDLDYIEEKRIKIISLKGETDFLSNIRATPEHTFGLVLSLLKNYKVSFLNLKNRKWNRYKYWGNEIFNNNIGIIGFGRVGKILAKYFNSFGAKNFFYDIDLNVKPIYNAIRLDSIKELIKKSNIIIMCVAYSSENHRFFREEFIDLLKDKYFINTSRGELLNENYLIKKIEENHFKGIALDVISNETQKKNNFDKFISLTKNRNFILTPHIAGLTYESIHKTEEFIVRKLMEEI